MEIAVKVVEDANFSFFFNRTIAAAGWITSQFGNWRKRYQGKGREQIVIKDFSRKENSSEVVGWSKRLRWIMWPAVSKLFIIFVLGAILESLFTQSWRSFSLWGPVHMRCAILVWSAGSAQLVRYFLLKLLLCFYEKAGRPACRDPGCLNGDFGKRASPPSYINTTTILRGNEAWAEPARLPNQAGSPHNKKP